jgi:NAD(P)-dependent dehydrogenase (short-subunit alcohol dehydrogenase family)
MSARFPRFLSVPRTVWITGASSGIGREIALQLAQEGHRVVISARNADALQEMALLYPQHLFPLPVDAADDASMREAGNKMALLAPTLDLAILNAGTCEYLDDGSIDMALVSRVMSVNFNGTLQAANIALPHLKLAAKPALYVVSSQVTSLPLTRSGAYGASKAALEYFFRSLRIDWLGTGIFIGIIRPGFVKTPLTDRNDFPMPWLWTADKAARKILAAIDRRQPELTFPFALHAALSLIGSLPHDWWATLAQGTRKKGTHKNSGEHRP